MKDWTQEQALLNIHYNAIHLLRFPTLVTEDEKSLTFKLREEVYNQRAQESVQSFLDNLYARHESDTNFTNYSNFNMHNELPIGIRNIGNTCYLNSFLISILSTNCYNDFLDDRITFLSTLKNPHKDIQSLVHQLQEKSDFNITQQADPIVIQINF